jgi:hypothetical protein
MRGIDLSVCLDIGEDRTIAAAFPRRVALISKELQAMARSTLGKNLHVFHNITLWKKLVLTEL